MFANIKKWKGYIQKASKMKCFNFRASIITFLFGSFFKILFGAKFVCQANSFLTIYPFFDWFFKLSRLFKFLYFWRTTSQILGPSYVLSLSLCSIINGCYKRCFKVINIYQVVVIIYSLCKNIRSNLLR